jgi:hypothetical protein
MTPDEIRAEILKVRAELLRGPDAVRDAEIPAELADLDADAAFDRALLTATGSVEEKKATARLAADSLRRDAVVSRAAYNRVKVKVRQLETEMFALQSVLKSIQAEGA